jgi:hypothetical protein
VIQKDLFPVGNRCEIQWPSSRCGIGSIGFSVGSNDDGNDKLLGFCGDVDRD